MSALLVSLVLLATGCGSDKSARDQPSRESTTPAAATTTARSSTTSEIVGRWKRTNKCAELVEALDDAGLGALGPAMVGDYFPGTPSKQLAKKNDLCAGAKPIVHYHFFDEGGRFGSLDGQEEQVDDGTYRLVGDRSAVISKEFGDVKFEYEVKGDKLALSPGVTPAMEKLALAQPLEFSAAGWATSVSYPGHEWTRVACDAWC